MTTEKWKPYEIYRRMCDVYREAYFSRKDVYKWDNYGLVTTNRTEVFHQIFVGWEVQTIWTFQKNLWYVPRSMLETRKCLQMGLKDGFPLRAWVEKTVHEVENTLTHQ